MSKSTVWNQLKSLGYTSEQLKIDTGKTYQSVNEAQLQKLLEQVQQASVVNEVTTTKYVTNETEVITKLTPDQIKQRFEAYDIYLGSHKGKWQVQFKVSSDSPSKIYTYSKQTYALIDLAEKLKLVTADEVKAYRNKDQRCYKRRDPVNVEVLKQVLRDNPEFKLEDLVVYCMDNCNYRADEVLELGKTLFPVATETEETVSEVQEVGYLLVHNQADQWLNASVNSNNFVQDNVTNEVKQVSEIITEATETTFDVANEKLKQPLPDLKQIADPWNDELDKEIIQFMDQLASVPLPNQQIPSTTELNSIFEPTCTCNHPVIEEIVVFPKTEITSLQVDKLDNTATELVNLSDVYFIELRSKDNRLYISRGLNIKSFSGKHYRINDAFNSLVDGSNFIKLVDKREKNRVILVNLLNVRKLEYKKDKLVIHWHGLLTIPGIHKFTEWTIEE